MPIVFIPTLLRASAGGAQEVRVAGSTVRQVIENLELQYPGLKDRLVEEGRLRPNLAVAVDGEISPTGLLEQVTEASEIHFLTAIKGGL